MCELKCCEDSVNQWNVIHESCVMWLVWANIKWTISVVNQQTVSKSSMSKPVQSDYTTKCSINDWLTNGAHEWNESMSEHLHECRARRPIVRPQISRCQVTTGTNNRLGSRPLILTVSWLASLIIMPWTAKVSVYYFICFHWSQCHTSWRQKNSKKDISQESYDNWSNGQVTSSDTCKGSSDTCKGSGDTCKGSSDACKGSSDTWSQTLRLELSRTTISNVPCQVTSWTSLNSRSAKLP